MESFFRTQCFLERSQCIVTVVYAKESVLGVEKYGIAKYITDSLVESKKTKHCVIVQMDDYEKLYKNVEYVDIMSVGLDLFEFENSDGYTVVVLDSMSFLMEQYGIHAAVHFIKKLKSIIRYGQILCVMNTTACRALDVKAILVLADVKVCVETEDCILARPVLEQKAYITVLPILKLKTGMCTMLRRMMSGRLTQNTEVFTLHDSGVLFESVDKVLKETCETKPKENIQDQMNDVVSFNLQLTEGEKSAKDHVQLPYQHTGGSNYGSQMGENIFFIDPDDPDWDDDDDIDM